MPFFTLSIEIVPAVVADYVRSGAVRQIALYDHDYFISHNIVHATAPDDGLCICLAIENDKWMDNYVQAPSAGRMRFDSSSFDVARGSGRDDSSTINFVIKMFAVSKGDSIEVKGHYSGEGYIECCGLYLL